MFLRFFTILTAFIWLPALAYYSLGKPAGFVNDFAGLLNSQEKASLEQKLRVYEQETNHEIALAIIPNLKGDTIENFAVKLFEEWGIGKTKADNGVLLLAALEEREVRIEVGYGLEGAITDAESFWIIQNLIVPSFRSGSYAKGLDTAVDSLTQAASEEIVPVSASKNNQSRGGGFIPFIIAWFFLEIIVSMLASTKSWWLGGVVGGVVAAVAGFFMASLIAGLVTAAFFVPFGLFFDYVVSKRRAAGLPVIFWRGRGPFGGGGGGGFDGFGGGRSGGGGSSGRW